MSFVRAVFKIDKGLFKQANAMAPRLMAQAANEESSEILRDLKGGKHRAPKRSGRLRRSYERIRSHRGLRYLIRANPQIAPHAGFVEFGTRNMAAQPHFRPAIRAARRRFSKRASRIVAAGFRGL